MTPNNRNLFRFIMEVTSLNEDSPPLLAALAEGRWQIVSAEGKELGEPANTPYLAWKSAAESIQKQPIVPKGATC